MTKRRGGGWGGGGGGADLATAEKDFPDQSQGGQFLHSSGHAARVTFIRNQIIKEEFDRPHDFM